MASAESCEDLLMSSENEEKIPSDALIMSETSFCDESENSRDKHPDSSGVSFNSEASPEDSLTSTFGTFCSLHSGKMITHFCKSENSVFCEVCKATKHTHCKENVVEIAKVASSREQIDDELKKFHDKLYETRAKYNQNKTKAEGLIKEVKEMHQRSLSTFKSTIDSVRDRENNNLQTIVTASEEVLKQVNVWEREASKGAFNKEQCKNLFILIKSAQEQLQAMCTNEEHLRNGNAITRYAFNTVPITGQIIGPLMKKPYLIREINVQYGQEKKDCVIIDMVFVGEDRMLVTDRSNCSIKLVDIKNDAVVSHTFVKHYPHQMTVTNNGDVYITIPKAKTMLKLTSPKGDVTKNDVIATHGHSFAIEYQNGTLIMQEWSTSHSYKIVENDLNGGFVKVIIEDLVQSDKVKSSVFSKPHPGPPLYSVLDSKSGDVIFTSHKQNAIVALSRKGLTKEICQSSNLDGPHGLDIDLDGTILVVSTEKRKVLAVKDGKISEILPEQVGFKPVSLRLVKKTGQLYVGGVNNTVHVYAT